MMSVVYIVSMLLIIAVSFISLIFFIYGVVHVVMTAYCTSYANALLTSHKQCDLDLKRLHNAENIVVPDYMESNVLELRIQSEVMRNRALNHRHNIVNNFVLSFVMCLLAIGISLFSIKLMTNEVPYNGTSQNTNIHTTNTLTDLGNGKH